MGQWDRELIELLPRSMQVMASAGAGFDWVDVDVLGEHGKHEPLSRNLNAKSMQHQCT